MNDAVLAAMVVAVPALALVAIVAMRRPMLAVCLVPASFPLEQLDVPGLPLRPTQLATVAAVALVTLGREPHPVPLPRSPVLVAAGLAVVSALSSTVVAVDPAAALRLDATYVTGFAFAVATTVACRDRRTLQALLGFTCAVSTLIAVAGIASAVALRAHYGATVVDNRATGFFGQPNELGAYTAVLVILAAALYFSLPYGSPARVLPAVCAVTSAAALVVSLSRSSWIGFALGLAVLLVMAPAVRRPVAQGFAGLAVGLGVVVAARPSHPLVSIVAERAASIVDGGRNPYDDRPAIWQEALRQVAARPYLGSGPGGYPVLAARTPSQVTTVAPDHAHDLVLTVAAEQGLVGVGLLVAAVLVAAFAVARALHRCDAVDRVLMSGATAGLATILGQGLLDYPLRNAALETVVWLLLGVLAVTVAGAGSSEFRMPALGRTYIARHSAGRPAWEPTRGL